MVSKGGRPENLVDAQCGLGSVCTCTARPDCRKNFAEALSWYRKAADQGNAEAQNGVGLLYANGWGVAQDYGEARLWFDKRRRTGQRRGPVQPGRSVLLRLRSSAESGQSGLLVSQGGRQEQPGSHVQPGHACTATGPASNGITPRPPSGSAKRPTEVTPRRNISLGSFTRRERESRKTPRRPASGSPRPPAKATKTPICRRRRQGELPQRRRPRVPPAATSRPESRQPQRVTLCSSTVRLGLLYQKGRGVEQDYAKAVQWFRKAADKNHPLAQYELGVAYRPARASSRTMPKP